MEKIENHTRRFSLGSDFMNFKTNDLLYGFMRALSTACPDEVSKFREYLPIKTFTKNKKMIAQVLGCSTRTIDRHLEQLAKAGLIDEGVEVKGEYEYPCFWFPYDESKAYKLLDSDLVLYLVNTRNVQCIRVYLYLLNKYQWKRGYLFSIQELKEALGYASSTKTADAIIKDILTSFRNEGIIAYEKVYEQVDIGTKIVPVERLRLDYVVSKKSELGQF